MAKKHAGGRPTSVTEAVLTKLEYMFSCNGNNTEACLYAGICTKTLDRYIEKNPEFSLRIEQLRSSPRMKAKINIKLHLDEKAVGTSQWVLNHTDPDYKPKSKVENEINISAQDALIIAIAERRRTREANDGD